MTKSTIEVTKRPKGLPSEWGIYKQKERRAILMLHHNLLMAAHRQEMTKAGQDKIHKETYERVRPGLRAEKHYESTGALFRNIMMNYKSFPFTR